jgi:hypothetical protein
MTAMTSYSYNNAYIQMRKRVFAKSRSSISEKTWIEYLEEAYPDWWAAVYKDKWPINIIYYTDDLAFANLSPKHQSYPFYVNKNSTMRDIMLAFWKFLNAQYIAIQMCFGDVASLITQHLPKLFDIGESYLYIHKHHSDFYSEYKIIKNTYSRHIVPNDQKLIRLCGELCTQNTDCINFRLRYGKIDKRQLKSGKKREYPV